jgi:cytochrome c oxidase cbb3-type subunit 4
MTTYTFLAGIAQTWGMITFISGFALAVLYALLPSNRVTFDEAARRPLLED